MNYFNILLYIILIIGLIRIFSMSARNTNTKIIVNAVQKVFDRDEFYSYVDTQLANMKSKEFRNKMLVIKLWGEVYHNDFDKYPETLQEIDVGKVLQDDKGRSTITENEDALFYLYLAIPNALYGKDRDDLRKLLAEKMQPYHEQLKSHMACAIGSACSDYYENTNNKGKEFFERILDGDYEEYDYSKQLISMYKNICSAMLYEEYSQTNDQRLEEAKSMIEYFRGMGAGERWYIAKDKQLKDLDFDDDKEVIEETTEENSEEK